MKSFIDTLYILLTLIPTMVCLLPFCLFGCGHMVLEDFLEKHPFLIIFSIIFWMLIFGLI